MIQSWDGPAGDSTTERLYFQDAYQTEFEAEVLATKEMNGHPALLLASTCFYPEGGGQPSDEGEINGVKVIQVYEEEGQIWHWLEREVKAEKVRGKVNWQRRFDHMQQHSGQHLLSQVCWELLRAETLSFHLGETVSTIELSLTHLAENEKKQIEKRVAELIFQNLPIKTYFLDETEASQLPLRKKPVKSGRLRIVEIQSYDYSACGGTHVRSTGEIGLVKIIGSEKIRQHVRISFVAGGRALTDYQKKNEILDSLAGIFSTSLDQVINSVAKLRDEVKALKKQNRRYGEELNQYEAEKIIAESSGLIIDRIFTDRTLEEVKDLALKIIHRARFLVIFGFRGETQDHLLLARSEAIAVDLRTFIPFLRDTLEAKGGGRESLVEMACPKNAPLEEAIQALRAKIGQAL